MGGVTVLALFCYLIIPDNSPNANQQIPKIALSKPMAVHTFYIESNHLKKNVSVLHKLVNGVANVDKYNVVDSFEVSDEEAIIYFGKGKKIIDITDENKFNEKLVQKTFILGTDKYGRDVFSRLVVGLRVSLMIGFYAVILSVFVGTLFGVLAGFYGGKVDRIVMTIINVNWSIPTILLAFAILLVMEKGLTAIYLAIGLTLWVDLARIIRGQVMEIREKEYILAAKILGYSAVRTMVKHIFPNVSGTILVIASINFATAILVESGLSYLGLGVQPPVASLGNMLKENYGYASSGFVVLSIAPAISILLLVLSFNLLGNGLKDFFDLEK